MVKVKICGIRRVEDALAAVAAGADAIGLLVGQRYASSDFLDAAVAGDIAPRVPPFTTVVLVTHLPLHESADVRRLLKTATDVGASAVQLHGETNLRATREFARHMYDRAQKVIKAVHANAAEAFDEAMRYASVVDAILLDTANLATGQVSGTGLTHDWSVSRLIAAQCPKPVILAGGLTPENVAEAIRTVRPYGVDVNSGVNGPDGYKDPTKLRRFVAAAKADDDSRS